VLLGTNSQQAMQAAERVRSRVDSNTYISEAGQQTIKMSTSIGVACCPEHGMDKATIIRLADETMYEAKKGGKNRVVMVKSSLKYEAPQLADLVHSRAENRSSDTIIGDLPVESDSKSRRENP
jgi:predicted signal transduction protein with EAL and GGDEF domain